MRSVMRYLTEQSLNCNRRPFGLSTVAVALRAVLWGVGPSALLSALWAGSGTHGYHVYLYLVLSKCCPWIVYTDPLLYIHIVYLYLVLRDYISKRVRGPARVCTCARTRERTGWWVWDDMWDYKESLVPARRPRDYSTGSPAARKPRGAPTPLFGLAFVVPYAI